MLDRPIERAQHATMNGRAGPAKTWLSATLWLSLILACGWFLVEALTYTVSREPQPGATFFNRGMWVSGHIATAIPLLFIGPLQFSNKLRLAKPVLHRRLGQVFLAGSIFAAIMAIYIGATIQYQGSRLPLTIFGIVWAAFAIAAWIAALNRKFDIHRKFVIRTYALALAFVWVRLMGAIEDQLFWFIDPGDVRDATREWLSFVLPLLIVETALSWWPDVERAKTSRIR